MEISLGAIAETGAVTSGMIMITGGIGSGKSVVSRILRLNGYRVYDCDSEAKRIMENDYKVIAELIKILGEEAYSLDGGSTSIRRINRPFIASRIFGDAELRCMVNEVVHQAVREDVLRFAQESEELVFCETAIPVTSKMTGMSDAIWLVTAPESERIERVKIRNGLSEEEIIKRIESQREEFDRLDDSKTIRIENGRDNMILPRIYDLLAQSGCNEIIKLLFHPSSGV